MYYKNCIDIAKSLLLFIILCNANSNAQSKLEGIIKDSITKNNIPL
jgi:hypothetical protein